MHFGIQNLQRIKNIKKYSFFPLLFSTSLAYAQKGGKAEKLPIQDKIFQIRKEADAAFVLKAQSIVPDTCKSSTSGNMFVVNARILKKYFDKTNKFKDTKITYRTSDTTGYSAAAHSLVFLNHTEAAQADCPAILWLAKPASAFVFSPKLEAMVEKKEK